MDASGSPKLMEPLRRLFRSLRSLWTSRPAASGSCVYACELYVLLHLVGQVSDMI